MKTYEHIYTGPVKHLLNLGYTVTEEKDADDSYTKGRITIGPDRIVSISGVDQKNLHNFVTFIKNNLHMGPNFWETPKQSGSLECNIINNVMTENGNIMNMRHYQNLLKEAWSGSSDYMTDAEVERIKAMRYPNYFGLKIVNAIVELHSDDYYLETREVSMIRKTYDTINSLGKRYGKGKA